MVIQSTHTRILFRLSSVVCHFLSAVYRLNPSGRLTSSWEDKKIGSENDPLFLNTYIRRHSSSSLLSKNLKIKIYRIIILPLLLYGCETWSLTLRKDRRLRVFENRVLKRIFGPKRVEVTGERRKPNNE